MASNRCSFHIKYSMQDAALYSCGLHAIQMLNHISMYEAPVFLQSWFYFTWKALYDLSSQIVRDREQVTLI